MVPQENDGKGVITHMVCEQYMYKMFFGKVISVTWNQWHSGDWIFIKFYTDQDH